MPYKLSPRGMLVANAVEAFDIRERPEEWKVWFELTKLQRQAVDFLAEPTNVGYVMSSEIATFYGYAPQAMRGPMYYLWKKGLVEKED
jgi:hypothetical protein